MSDLKTPAGVLEWTKRANGSMDWRGNVEPPDIATAARIAKAMRLLEALEFGACLACGAEPGCDIDCALCVAYDAALTEPEET